MYKGKKSKIFTATSRHKKLSKRKILKYWKPAQSSSKTRNYTLEKYKSLTPLWDQCTVFESLHCFNKIVVKFNAGSSRPVRTGLDNGIRTTDWVRTIQDSRLRYNFIFTFIKACHGEKAAVSESGSYVRLFSALVRLYRKNIVLHGCGRGRWKLNDRTFA